jgi:hypothetical protein
MAAAQMKKKISLTVPNWPRSPDSKLTTLERYYSGRT